MNSIRNLFSAACISTLAGIAIASAATPTAPPASGATSDAAAMRQGRHEGRGGPDGAMRQVIDQLDLTAEQKKQVKAIFSSAKPQLQAVHESGRATRDQLAITPPTDAGYAGLVETAKSNAAEKIQLMSDLWSQVYATLTPDQRSRIPGIVAAQRAERGAHRKGWNQPPSDT